MKQCINCLNENISTVVDNNRIFYRCPNCGSTESRAIDKSGQIVSSIENGLTKHVTVAVLIKRNGKIALVNRKNFPYGLCFPCGHLEYGETPSKGAERELVEELGLKVTQKRLIFHETILDQCKAGGDLHEWYLYDCKTEGQIVLNSETDQLKWVSKKELPNLDIVPPAKMVMARIGLLEKYEAEKNLTSVGQRQNNMARDEKESIIENLPIAIVIFDKKGELTFSNNPAKALLNNLKGCNLQEKLLYELSELAKRSIKNKAEMSREFSFSRDIFNLTTSLTRAEGKITGASVTIRNVSGTHKQGIKDLIAYQTSLPLCGSIGSYRVIKTVLSQLMLSFDVSSINLMLLDGQKLRTALNISKKLKDEYKNRLGQGIAEAVISKKHLLAVPDTSKDERFSGDKRKPYSLLSVPVIFNKDVHGVLNVTRPKNSFFEEDEVNMVSIVANRIALAIENERLYKSLLKEKLSLEKVLATTTDGLIMVDKRFNLIFTNEAAIKLLPLKAGDLENNTLEGYFSDLSRENSDRLKRYIAESIRRKKRFEIEFVSKKGAEKVVKARFSPVIQNNDECDSVLIGFSNITKLIGKQRQVKQQVKQLTELFKISSQSIINSDNFFQNVLRKTAIILDSEKSDIFPVANNGDLSGITRSNDKDMNSLFNQIRQITSFETNFLCNNVKTHFTGINNISRIIATPIRLNGKTIGLLYAVNKKSRYNSKDMKWAGIIAERLASRLETANLFNELRKDRQQIEKIINNSGDGIIVRRASDHEVIVWNKAMERITGFKTNVQSRKGNQHIAEFVDQAIQEGKDKCKDKIYKELKYYNSDNVEQWLGVNFSFIRDLKGDIEYVISNVRDISQDKILEERNKEFIYTTTHELRTPITAIKGYLSMILNGDAGKINPKQRKYFNRAYKSTENLVQLVEDLLKTAKIEENKISVEKRRFSVNKLIDEVVSDFKQKATDKKINFTETKKKGDIVVFADYDSTKQAIANLVDNAIKYTVKQGSVTIEASEMQKNVVIAVQDTGVGIPKKEQESVFTKFYRVPNSESIRAGGTGLGLFIVKNLIEKQGGKIEIDSTLGKGTRISILLPLK